MGAWTDAEIDAQIASLKTQLTENTAALKSARQAQQYSQDTGQGRVMKMNQQISQLQNDRRRILEEINEWHSLKTGGGAITVEPGW